MAPSSRFRTLGSQKLALTKTALLLLLFVALLCAQTAITSSKLACHQVRFGAPQLDNICCLCNASHCDSLAPFRWPLAGYLRLSSDKAGARFALDLVPQSKFLNESGESAGKNSSTNNQVDYLVELEVNKRRQQVVGFGGAFTDSASQLIGALPAQVRAHLLTDYFGPEGLDYNMGRLPISGTDMSSRAYSYDDLAPGNEDLELRSFKLQPEDLELKIPLIKQVNALRGARNLEPLKLMAASWSAPAWMKSNANLVQGKLRSEHAYYDAYARYVIKFLDEYEKRNLSMWALSPQNEPLSPKRVGPVKINFNSVNFEPEEMVAYLERSLVPQLLAAGRLPKLKLFLWDDTLDGLQRYQEAALAAPQVRKHAAGLALHWYSQGLHEISYRRLHEARQALPAQYAMMSTEASFIGRPRPGDWARGQRYARDLIENLRAGSVAWLDWNLALNMSGGPTWSHNYLDAALLVDGQVYYKNPMYYALGHVSRFIVPNSHVLATEVRAPGQAALGGAPQDELSAVGAELEPEKINDRLVRRVALVLLNRVASKRRVQIQLADCQAKAQESPLELELAANSITSLAFVC